jgi:hypothetical protein
VIRGRLIWEEGRVRDDLAEEEKAPRTPVDDAGVLTDPADAGPGGGHVLQDRARIDANGAAGPRAVLHDRPGELAKPPGHDAVVVAPPGVTGDPAATWLTRRRGEGARGLVGEADAEHRAGAGEHAANIEPLLGARPHPRHRARVAPGEPFEEAARLRPRLGPRDADPGKAQRSRPLAHPRGERRLLPRRLVACSHRFARTHRASAYLNPFLHATDALADVTAAPGSRRSHARRASPARVTMRPER